jgi:hypothetical protein
MQVTAAQLNKIATLLGTTDRNVVINAAIATLVKSGMDITDATDAVLGEGAYMRIAGEIYNKLRAKAH